MCIFYKNKFQDFFGKWTFINVQFLKPQPFIEKIKICILKIKPDVKGHIPKFLTAKNALP
jgi:hypothetical protein